MIVHSNRTPHYLVTVDLNDPKDMEVVEQMRKTVREFNKFYRDSGNSQQFYVKLQGRGHRMGNRRYHQSLPLKFADTADVYMYERR